MQYEKLRQKMEKLKESIHGKQIKLKEVRLIDENGKQIGIVPLQEALRIANEKGLVYR